jgi:hypothetical protein
MPAKGPQSTLNSAKIEAAIHAACKELNAELKANPGCKPNIAAAARHHSINYTTLRNRFQGLTKPRKEAHVGKITGHMTRVGYGYGSSRVRVRAVNLPPVQNPRPWAWVGGQGTGFFFVLLSSSTANTLKPITVSLSEATIALAPPATSGPCVLHHSFISSVTCCGLPSSSSMAHTPSMPYDSNLRPLSLLAVMSLCQADSMLCLYFILVTRAYLY